MDIKFQAFDEKLNTIFAVHELNFQEINGKTGKLTLIRGYSSKGCTMMEGRDVFGGHNAKRIKLMQFTGLQDMDKIDIYDADILLVDEHYKAKVIQANGYFCVIYYKEGIVDGRDFLYRINHNSRKIGNWYQNPELLRS